MLGMFLPITSLLAYISVSNQLGRPLLRILLLSLRPAYVFMLLHESTSFYLWGNSLNAKLRDSDAICISRWFLTSLKKDIEIR